MDAISSIFQEKSYRLKIICIVFLHDRITDVSNSLGNKSRLLIDCSDSCIREHRALDTCGILSVRQLELRTSLLLHTLTGFDYQMFISNVLLGEWHKNIRESTEISSSDVIRAVAARAQLLDANNFKLGLLL